MYTNIEMSSFVLIVDSLVYYKFKAFHAVLLHRMQVVLVLCIFFTSP